MTHLILGADHLFCVSICTGCRFSCGFWGFFFLCLRGEYLNPKVVKRGFSLQVVWISGIHSRHKWRILAYRQPLATSLQLPNNLFFPHHSPGSVHFTGLSSRIGIPGQVYAASDFLHFPPEFMGKPFVARYRRLRHPSNNIVSLDSHCASLGQHLAKRLMWGLYK